MTQIEEINRKTTELRLKNISICITIIDGKLTNTLIQKINPTIGNTGTYLILIKEEVIELIELIPRLSTLIDYKSERLALDE